MEESKEVMNEELIEDVEPEEELEESEGKFNAKSVGLIGAALAGLIVVGVAAYKKIKSKIDERKTEQVKFVQVDAEEKVEHETEEDSND